MFYVRTIIRNVYPATWILAFLDYPAEFIAIKFHIAVVVIVWAQCSSATMAAIPTVVYLYVVAHDFTSFPRSGKSASIRHSSVNLLLMSSAL